MVESSNRNVVRRLVYSSSAILVIAALGILAYFTLLEEEAPPPRLEVGPPEILFEALDTEEVEEIEEAVAAEPQTPRLILASFEGRVEIRRGGVGPWLPAEPDSDLDPSDAVRTSPGAAAELSAGDHIIRLLPSTDVRVEELTADLSRFLLGKGMVAAEARGEADEGRRLQIEVAGTDVTTGTDSGRFRVSASRDGVVAVGAEEGRVTVAARGREVVLRAGEGTLVPSGRAPADPSPLPDSLLLRVAWPEETETNKSTLTVTGRTAAGALIFVAGRAVDVDEQGRFETEVRLRDGRNRVRVEGFDVAGNRAGSRSPPIVVDTRGSKARFDTEDLWAE